MDYDLERFNEKILKKVIGFFKELKMDNMDTIEEKKKRLKEIKVFIFLMDSLGLKDNIKL